MNDSDYYRKYFLAAAEMEPDEAEYLARKYAAGELSDDDPLLQEARRNVAARQERERAAQGPPEEDGFPYHYTLPEEE